MLHDMGLYSLVIDHEGRSYTTQVEAGSAEGAVEHYLRAVYPVSATEAFGPNAPVLRAQDVIYVTPMQGLENLWAVSVGSGGRYISAVCVLTEPSHAT